MKRVLLLVFAGIIFSSCTKENIGDTIIKDSIVQPTEIDNWISDNMNVPFNIEVIYKWNDEESDLSKNLVPPQEDSVLTFLNVVKTLWIDTYVDQAGEDFIKFLAPKQLLLIGSLNWNTNGTVTEGTAEGGRKIVLYGVNRFEAKNKDHIKHMIHVIHHEFAHIMHQTKDYGVEFGKITPSGYTSTWFNISTEEARNNGFITSYAQMNTNEDFVEMISNFLINSHDEWEAILAGIEDPEGVAAIREKEALIAEYFTRSWGIDIYEFQELVSSEIEKLVNS
jgi:substrate import-associated zinc metallohydrolase lipoprotein